MSKAPTIKTLLLSNITVDSFLKRFPDNFEVSSAPGFDTWMECLLNRQSILYQNIYDLVIITLDGRSLMQSYNTVSDLRDYLEQCVSLITEVTNNLDKTHFIISNLDLFEHAIQPLHQCRPYHSLEHFWEESILGTDSHTNRSLLDIKALVDTYGRIRIYNEKLWYLGNLRFSMEAEKFIIEQIILLHNAFLSVRKKCLILDLDNTLWGGLAGEEGIEGISLAPFKEGARFYDFQKRILAIQQTGIILAVISKNNEEDALKIIRNHPSMLLREESFAALYINWEEKAHNILNLSKELNLSLSSFVFVDDNPIERDKIKQLLPDVAVPEFPKDSSLLPSFAQQLYFDYFAVSILTAEDKKKTSLYQENAQRKAALQNALSFDDYLTSLETKIHIHTATDSDLPRILQLVQKTNQFNLTTIRYSFEQLQEILCSLDYQTWAISVSDKFGDSGYVAVVILHISNSKTAYIESFIMSCRVMGRYIEDSIIDYIENWLREEKFESLICLYKYTEKNKPVADLYDRLGYTLIEYNEIQKKYLFPLEKALARKRYSEMIVGD